MQNEVQDETQNNVSKEEAEHIYFMLRSALFLLMFNAADIAFLNGVMHGNDHLFTVLCGVVCGVFLWTSPMWLRLQRFIIAFIVISFVEAIFLSYAVSPAFCKMFAITFFGILLLVPIAWFITLTVVIVRQYKKF